MKNVFAAGARSQTCVWCI